MGTREQIKERIIAENKAKREIRKKEISQQEKEKQLQALRVKQINESKISEKPKQNRFKTVGDVIEDKIFVHTLKNVLSSIERSRDLHFLPENMKFRRSAYDEIKEGGGWNADFFIEEFLLNEQGNKRNSSRVRAYVRNIIFKAVNEVLEYYEKKDKQEKIIERMNTKKKLQNNKNK